MSRARLGLLDALVFNILIGNNDAHPKNYTVLIGAGGTALLAPVYDLLSTIAWPGVATTLPQAINGTRDPAIVHGDDWRALARTVGLSPATTHRRVRPLGERVVELAGQAEAAVEAMPAGSDPHLRHVRRSVEKRTARILRQL